MKTFLLLIALFWIVPVLPFGFVHTNIAELVSAYLVMLGFWCAGAGNFRNETAGGIWGWGFFYSLWFLFEQILVFIQKTTHHGFFQHKPTTILEVFIPQIETHGHLVFKIVITLFIGAALYLENRFGTVLCLDERGGCSCPTPEHDGMCERKL